MKRKAKSEKRKIIGGFTLIEALVAITILLIGVLGPITAATRGITDGLYAQNQLVGTHLAQEGLELLNLRIDENNKPNMYPTSNNQDHDGDGDTDIDDLLYSLGACKNSGCAVVFTSGTNLVDFTFETCANADNCQIAYSQSDDFYRPYPGGSGFVGPVFTRVLTIEILSDIDVLLTSRVEWRNKAAEPTPKTVELSRYAFHQK